MMKIHADTRRALIRHAYRHPRDESEVIHLPNQQGGGTNLNNRVGSSLFDRLPPDVRKSLTRAKSRAEMDNIARDVWTVYAPHRVVSKAVPFGEAPPRSKKGSCRRKQDKKLEAALKRMARAAGKA